MKFAVLLSLISLSSFAASDAGWKVVAETSDCSENVQIEAKEGEKFVYAVRDGKKSQLNSTDGSAYSAKGMKDTHFAAAKTTSEPSIAYTQPSYVNGNPPKIDITHAGVKKNCRMTQK